VFARKVGLEYGATNKIRISSVFLCDGKSPGRQVLPLRAHQTIKLNTFVGQRDHPDKLRRISYVDPETGHVGWSSSPTSSSCTACDRADLPLATGTSSRSFACIKHHLVCGILQHLPQRRTRPNWSAICAYLLGRHRQTPASTFPQSLWEILPIPIQELLISFVTRTEHINIHNQLAINHS